MAGGDLLVDRLVAGGFLRPAMLLRGLQQLRRSAHRQLLGAFESSRHRIHAGQLVELPYETLIRQPFAAVKRIYDELGLSSWPVAQASLQARIAQARSYTADPVTLPFAAEQRLNDLMEEV